MRAELACVDGRRARWGFSLGCSRTAVALRMRAAVMAPERGGGGARASLLMAIGATVLLAFDGLVRYPGLRTGPGAWLSAAAFVMLMLAYVVAALSLSRGETRAAAIARRYGLGGGVAVGAGWLLILAPVSKAFVFVPLAIALLAPAGVAVLAGRSSHDVRAGRAAALWSGLTGGLLVFIVWVTITYAHDGRPYDAQMMRDFRASGSHDLTAYAVGDVLGGALGLLLVIPVVALALGSLAGRATAGGRTARR